MTEPTQQTGVRLALRRRARSYLANPVAIRWTVATLTVFGAAVRYSVARQDLFADELATYWVVSTRGLIEVVETITTTAEITPPLPFVVSWISTRLGLSPELVRLPSLLAGIATIPLVYAVGVRTVGRGAALLASVLTTLSPFMIFYAAEARGYGVLMAVALASTLALLIAVDTGRVRWWGAYGLLVCLAAYTHYTAIFVLAAQLAWACWMHPSARRPALVATALAVVAYLPWLPSLRGDIDSPTTDILSAFSPVSLELVRLSLGHWSIGFPFSGPERGLSDLPGRLALALLSASVVVGLGGIVTRRARLGAWFAARGGRIGLVTVLALATPVGTLAQSGVGTNVFSTRSLAASWPYLAIAVAALITVGPPAVRLTAAGLAVAAFGLGTATMITDDAFQRPEYTRIAAFIDEHPGGVVIDGAGFTPGPLTNFEVEGSTPNVPVLRLNTPEQMTLPFAVGEPLPDPEAVAQRAAEAAQGGPITIVAFRPITPDIEEIIELLPEGYSITERTNTTGLIDLQALVFEQTGAARSAPVP